MRFRSMAVLALLGAMISLSVLATRAQWATRVLVIYSGYNQTLIDPIIDRFTFETGIKVEVRYGDTAELRERILLLDSAAAPDVFIAQDTADFARLSQRGYLQPLPDKVAKQVAAQYRADDWIGFAGTTQGVVSGVGIIAHSERDDLGEQFVAYLLSPIIQQYIATSGDVYPLALS